MAPRPSQSRIRDADFNPSVRDEATVKQLVDLLKQRGLEKYL